MIDVDSRTGVDLSTSVIFEAAERFQKPQPFTCWRGETVTRFGHAVAFNGNDRFGRLGNVMLAIKNMIIHAYKSGCSIEFPSDLIGMNNFNSSCLLLHFIGTNKATSQSDCPILSPSMWFNKNMLPLTAFEGEVVLQALRLYTNTNETHAYGASCDGRPAVAIHLRAGDVTDGKYNEHGEFISKKMLFRVTIQ